MRKRFNPAQFSLIKAHVTLCRDEDVRDWSETLSRAEMIRAVDVQLRFGQPIREQDLVYLPVVGSTEAFDQLRRDLLGEEHRRKQEPHITLVHPRNGSCTAEQFKEICSEFADELPLRFREFTFIEQTDGGPWRNIRSFPIDAPSFEDSGAMCDLG